MVWLETPSKHYHSLCKCILSDYNVEPAIFHKVTITFMENQGNKMTNADKMKVDEHSLVLIKNRLHHQILHTKMA